MRKYLLMLGASIALAIPLAAVTDAAARDYRINSWKNDPSCAEAKEKLAQGELMSVVKCEAPDKDSCFISCSRVYGLWTYKLNSGMRGCAQATGCVDGTCRVRIYEAYPCSASNLVESYTESNKHCGLPTYGSGGAGE